MSESFWIIPDVEKIRTPHAILLEQKTALEKGTRGLLTAIIENASTSETRISYNFYINAPSLNNYSYKLFNIAHDVFLYPVTVYWSQKSALSECQNEEVFLVRIKEIISSPETQRVLLGLLAQVRS